MIVTNSQFLTALTKLFEGTKENGQSVYLSTKKHVEKGEEFYLIRCTCNGTTVAPRGGARAKKSNVSSTAAATANDKKNKNRKKKKGGKAFSTLVSAQQQASFHEQYSNIMLVHLYGLKKKEKKTKRKRKKVQHRRASE
eukprot:g123.t1